MKTVLVQLSLNPIGGSTGKVWSLAVFLPPCFLAFFSFVPVHTRPGTMPLGHTHADVFVPTNTTRPQHRSSGRTLFFQQERRARVWWPRRRCHRAHMSPHGACAKSEALTFGPFRGSVLSKRSLYRIQLTALRTLLVLTSRLLLICESGLVVFCEC